MSKDQEIRKAIIQSQIEVIIGYYNKIFMNKMTVDEILDTLEKDKEFLREEQNILDAELIVTLDESPSPSEAGDGLIDGEQRCCNQCGGKLSEVRGRYPKQPKRIICPTCAIEELESMKQNNLTAKNNKDE